MSKALDRVVAEAREAFRPEAVDWDEIDQALFARLEAEGRAARDRAARERGQIWIGAAAALAAAVIVLVLLVRPGRLTSQDGDGSGIAATLLAVDGDGQIYVNGAPASVGTSLRRGDVIEGRGARATFVRPGRFTILVEPGARAVVARVEAPLVLTLEQGAVDAQVVPVANGEAFAVDIDGSRVAVHGTRLRVARDGGRVTVDLSEGVVSVGRAPRVGSVLGTLVTAPAHAEFAAADIRGTMAVIHDPAAVREPETGFDSVVSPAPPTAVVNPPASARSSMPFVEPRPAVNAAPKAGAAAPAESAVEPPAPSSSASPVVEPAPAPAVAPPGPDPDAENTVARAVRACISEHPKPAGVTVVVSTTLHLWVGNDGNVHSARFEPPVAPDINACAAEPIYRTRFPRNGSVNIRVDFSN